jgi:hypothetical protein
MKRLPFECAELTKQTLPSWTAYKDWFAKRPGPNRRGEINLQRSVTFDQLAQIEQLLRGRLGELQALDDSLAKGK